MRGGPQTGRGARNAGLGREGVVPRLVYRWEVEGKDRAGGGEENGVGQRGLLEATPNFSGGLCSPLPHIHLSHPSSPVPSVKEHHPWPLGP